MKRVDRWFDALGGGWLLMACMGLAGCAGASGGAATTPPPTPAVAEGALAFGVVEHAALDIRLDAPDEWSATSMGAVLVLAPGRAERDSVALVIAPHAAERDLATELGSLLDGTALQRREGPAPHRLGDNASAMLTVYESGAGSTPTRVESYQLDGFDHLLVALVSEAPPSEATRGAVARILASLRPLRPADPEGARW